MSRGRGVIRVTVRKQLLPRSRSLRSVPCALGAGADRSLIGGDGAIGANQSREEAAPGSRSKVKYVEQKKVTLGCLIIPIFVAK